MKTHTHTKQKKDKTTKQNRETKHGRTQSPSLICKESKGSILKKNES